MNATATTKLPRRIVVVGGARGWAEKHFLQRIEENYDVDIIQFLDNDSMRSWESSLDRSAELIVLITDLMPTQSHITMVNAAKKANIPFVRCEHRWPRIVYGLTRVGLKHLPTPRQRPLRAKVAEIVAKPVKPVVVEVQYDKCVDCGGKATNSNDKLCDGCAEKRLRLIASATPPPLKQPVIEQPMEKDEGKKRYKSHPIKGVRKCDACGNDFEWWRKDQMYCNDTCRGKGFRSRATEVVAAVKEEIVQSNVTPVAQPPRAQEENVLQLVMKLKAAMKREGIKFIAMDDKTQLEIK